MAVAVGARCWSSKYQMIVMMVRMLMRMALVVADALVVGVPQVKINIR